MEKRQKFTPEFKREAVRLLQKADKPAAAVAREPGIPPKRERTTDT
jgi:transposase